MTNPKDKRRLRNIKRKIKRSGNKKARQDLKRDLAQNPEEAHMNEFKRGRRRSENFNGMDHDAKRRRKDRQPFNDQEVSGIIPPEEDTNNGEGQEELPPVRPREQGNS